MALSRKVLIPVAATAAAAAIALPTSGILSGGHQAVRPRMVPATVPCRVSAQVPVKLADGNVVARGTVRCTRRTFGWTETALQIRKFDGTWLTIASRQKGFTAPAGRTLHFRSPEASNTVGTLRTQFTTHVRSSAVRRNSQPVVIN